MAVIRIRVFEPERFHRMRTAMLAPSLRTDRVQIGGEWYGREDIPMGQPVERITILDRHTFAPSDTLEVGDPLGTILIARANVLAIRLVVTSELTDVDFYAIGYNNRAEFEAGWGGVVAGAKTWWIDIERLDKEQSIQ